MKFFFRGNIRYKFIRSCILLTLSIAYLYTKRLVWQHQAAVRVAAQEVTDFFYEGVTFFYEGDSYDVTSCSDVINAIVSAEPIGKKILVEGHVCPHYAVYCIFDTKNREFERTIKGGSLIWRDNDVNTIVYAYGSEIREHDGRIIKAYEFKSEGYIANLEFFDNGEGLIVTINYYDGTEEKDIIEL